MEGCLDPIDEDGKRKLELTKISTCQVITFPQYLPSAMCWWNCLIFQTLGNLFCNLNNIWNVNYL